MGETDVSRKEREICTTQVFSSLEVRKMNPEGHLTGRQCLQYMASEVFKRNFDDAFWNKILNAKIKISCRHYECLESRRYHDHGISN